MKPNLKKGYLESVISGLVVLTETARKAEQPLLAFMLEQAKREAEYQLALLDE